MSDQAQAIVELERAALERWRIGDPSGFLEISAPDVVYFDPFLDSRLDGLEALTAYYESLRGTVNVPEWEMLHPLVQLEGEVAVLTFDFTSGQRWHCTEVYRRSGDRWRIIQTHWSLARAI